ncbi:uncharacterized protein METZ01_LOCUS357846, partial [marine metagenome]
MKKNIIILILLFNNTWAIGLQGLIIPQNGKILSTAGTGIAGDIHPALNPAMGISSHSYMQFSLNNWLGDVSGSHTLFRWGNEVPKQLSIQTWNAKDLELWGDSPDDSPMETFGIHYVSAAYSMSHHFNTPYRFGFRLQTNYSHLFTESLSGITLDVGATLPLKSFLTFGAVVRNLGYEYKNNLRAELPVESGIGAAIKLPIIKASILTDLLYSSSNGQEVRAGVSTNWKWININAGTSISENRNAQAMGFSLNYRKWKINYG